MKSAIADRKLYEAVALLSRSLSETAAVLQQLAAHRDFDVRTLRLFRIQVLEIRAATCQTILEVLAEAEAGAAGRLSRERLKVEQCLKG
jgi:ribosomal protein L22